MEGEHNRPPPPSQQRERPFSFRLHLRPSVTVASDRQTARPSVGPSDRSRPSVRSSAQLDVGRAGSGAADRAPTTELRGPEAERGRDRESAYVPAPPPTTAKATALWRPRGTTMDWTKIA